MQKIFAMTTNGSSSDVATTEGIQRLESDSRISVASSSNTDKSIPTDDTLVLEKKQSGCSTSSSESGDGGSSSSIEQISSSSGSSSVGDEKKPRNYSKLLKYVSLLVLILQNAALVLVTRYATTRQQTPFLKTVAVFFNEVVKIIVATMLFFLTTGPPKRAFRELREKFSFMDTLKLGVPALAYTIQTFLLYVSIENLDAGTFMVTYQLKILTTAFFTVLILKRRLSLWQWFALLLLVVGVATVQISAEQQNKKMEKATFTGGLNKSHIDALLLGNSSKHMGNLTATIINATQSKIPSNEHRKQNLLKGFLSVLTVCFLSGFAGVYIEKILKKSKELSIWMQNIQLAMMAIPISLCVIAFQDGRKVLEGGFMQGFDLPVWGIVSLQSLGGIATAIVIKYADNILKAFAVAFGIILVTIASIFIFSVFPKLLFIAGAALVIAAVAIYSLMPYNNKPKKRAPTVGPSARDLENAGKIEEGKNGSV